jgi:Arc/MetJ-type ribon-helix-helix transcriptional regulator
MYRPSVQMGRPVMAKRVAHLHVELDNEEADALDSIIPFREKSDYIRNLIRKDLESKGAFREKDAKRIIQERETYKETYGIEPEEVLSQLDEKQKEALLETIYKTVDMEPTNIENAKTKPGLMELLMMRINQAIEEKHLQVDPQIARDYIFKKVGENARR